MAKNEAKIRFTAETGEFNDAIKKSNEEMSELRAELKLNDAQMKTNGKSVDGLKNKKKILSDQLEASKDKVEALSNKVDKATEIFGEDSTEVSKLKTQLLNAKTAQEKIQQAINDCNDELEDQGKEARDAGDGFTVLKGAMADLVADGIQSVVSGFGDLATSLFDIVEDTKEYRTIMASLESSSELSGYTAEETAASFEQLNGVLGDTQSAATTTANLQAIGLEQAKVQSLTHGVIGAWAKYGDSIPIDGLAEAINHTSQLGEVQGTLADVLEWGGLSVEDFNAQLAECSTATERADLIARMLAEQGLTEAGLAWQETNEDIIAANNSQADYEANTATLAERVTPAITAVKDGFNAVFTEALNLTEGVDFEGIGEAISGAFQWFCDEGIPAIVTGIQDFVGWLQEAKTWIEEHSVLMAGVATAIGIVTTAIGLYNIVQGVKNAMDAAGVTTVWGLVAAHIAQAAAAVAAVAPYILIVAAIAAVIAIIVLLIKYWDEVVAACAAAWEWIKNILSQWGEWIYSNVIQPIVNFFTNLWENIKSIWNGIRTSISNAWSNIKTSVSTAINNVKTTVTSVFNSVKSKVTSVWNSIKNAIITPIETAKEKVKNVIDAIKGFFDFNFSWPHIPMPHFAISPSGWGIGDLLKGSIPSLSIDWYAKGGIFTKPTIFPTASGFKGVGEAGAEAVLPIDRLEGYIAGAVEKTMSVVNLQSLANAVEDLANRPVQLNINGRQFAYATASYGDSVNGLRSSFKSRGLAIE